MKVSKEVVPGSILRVTYRGVGAEAQGLHYAIAWLVTKSTTNTIVLSDEKPLQDSCVVEIVATVGEEQKKFYATCYQIYPVEHCGATIEDVVGFADNNELLKMKKELMKMVGF